MCMHLSHCKLIKQVHSKFIEVKKSIVVVKKARTQHRDDYVHVQLVDGNSQRSLVCVHFPHNQLARPI